MCVRNKLQPRGVQRLAGETRLRLAPGCLLQCDRCCAEGKVEGVVYSVWGGRGGMHKARYWVWPRKSESVRRRRRIMVPRLRDLPGQPRIQQIAEQAAMLHGKYSATFSRIPPAAAIPITARQSVLSQRLPQELLSGDADLDPGLTR